jgi:hypothetical protein
MPVLDPVVHDPMFTGPTIKPEHDVPLRRVEPFQLVAAKAPPLHMATRPRPMTTRVVHELVASKVPLTARRGNANPANAGLGDETADVVVNDPEAEPGEGDDHQAEARGWPWSRLAAGAAVGVALALLLRK